MRLTPSSIFRQRRLKSPSFQTRVKRLALHFARWATQWVIDGGDSRWAKTCECTCGRCIRLNQACESESCRPEPGANVASKFRLHVDSVRWNPAATRGLKMSNIEQIPGLGP